MQNKRPISKKLLPSEMFITGIRSVDTMFPLAKGASACIPGPFGAGKTVTQQSIAKNCNASIIIYVGYIRIEWI